MAKIQSFEQFRKTFENQPVEVSVDEFGKDAVFYFKPLSSYDRDAYEASIVGVDGKRDLRNLRAKLVAMCLVNAEGEPLATAEELGKERADVIGVLFDKVRHLNGMDPDEDVAEAGK